MLRDRFINHFRRLTESIEHTKLSSIHLSYATFTTSSRNAREYRSSLAIFICNLFSVLSTNNCQIYFDAVTQN